MATQVAASRMHMRAARFPIPIGAASSTTTATPRPLLHRRPFFSLPGSPESTTQQLSATRTLPYPLPPLYELIADVDSYSSFVPYCSHSRVTQWSAPNDQPNNSDSWAGRRWPTRADLHVGWGGFNEVFTSRLRCVPGASVEAVSGGVIDADGEEQASAVFKSLVTRWSVREAVGSTTGAPRTEVHLSIRYQFANPLYAAVSAAVSDRVAGVMIEAFEERARTQLGGKR